MSEAQRLPAPGDVSGMAEATPPAPGDGSGSGPGTGNPYSSVFWGGLAHWFKDTVASDPFGDRHAISSINEIEVNDVVRVDVSTYQDEASGGWSSISFRTLPVPKHAHHCSEEAAVFDVTGRDKTVRHVIAFAGHSRIAREGTISTMHKHFATPVDPH